MCVCVCTSTVVGGLWVQNNGGVCVHVCIVVCACVPVLGQETGERVRGEAFPPPPHGRARCKTRAPVVCCGNAAQFRLFSASASREEGCTSRSPDASVGIRWWPFGARGTLRGRHTNRSSSVLTRDTANVSYVDLEYYVWKCRATDKTKTLNCAICWPRVAALSTE